MRVVETDYHTSPGVVVQLRRRQREDPGDWRALTESVLRILRPRLRAFEVEVEVDLATDWTVEPGEPRRIRVEPFSKELISLLPDPTEVVDPERLIPAVGTAVDDLRKPDARDIAATSGALAIRLPDALQDATHLELLHRGRRGSFPCLEIDGSRWFGAPLQRTVLPPPAQWSLWTGYGWLPVELSVLPLLWDYGAFDPGGELHPIVAALEQAGWAVVPGPGA